MRGYIQTKARLFLRIGADRYRQADHFHQPDPNLGVEDLVGITAGISQLADGRGFSADQPLVGVESQVVADIAAIFHFAVSERLATPRVITFTLRHAVSGRLATIFAAPTCDDRFQHTISIGERSVTR